MTLHSALSTSETKPGTETFLNNYLNTLSMVERLHRLLLDEKLVNMAKCYRFS